MMPTGSAYRVRPAPRAIRRGTLFARLLEDLGVLAELCVACARAEARGSRCWSEKSAVLRVGSEGDHHDHFCVTPK